MPNAGFYQSLTASPHFDVRRQDAAQNLIMARQMRDDAVLQAQERMKSMGAISEYINKSQEIANQLLPNDAARVQEKEKQLRTSIVDGVNKYGGDASQFMLQEGTPLLDKYAREFSSSDELRTGIENKKNFTLGTDALMKRHVITPVEVEFPGGTKQTVDWIEALDLYNQDAIKKLPFNSSLPLVDFDPLEFTKIEQPDSERKYSGFVSMEALTSKLQAENPSMTDQEAKAQAKVYQNGDVKGASIIPWGRRLPHTSGSNTVSEKQLLEQQNVLQRYLYLKEGLNDPSLIEQIVVNQPYKDGFISSYTRPLKQVGNKMVPQDGILEYKVKNKRGNYETKTEVIPINKQNGYGLQKFNKLANVNKEGTSGFVNPEPFNQIYQSDPDFFGGDLGGGGTQHFEINGVGYDIPLNEVAEFKKDMGIK